MVRTKNSKFPQGFLWGASTSSHQIEGNTKNQWTEWELANSNKLANEAEKMFRRLEKYGSKANWSKIGKLAKDPNNYISGIGVNHHELYEKDFELLKELNMNAFRFGIEWSRIEPTEGRWDQKALDHYAQYIDKLNKLGIEPILTVWHWTMPTWFCDKGGFAKKKNINYFVRFVERITSEYSAKLKYIIILNEPNVYTSMSYLAGIWPPQKKNIYQGIEVYRNLAKAHKLSYRAVKSLEPNLNIGIAMSLTKSYPLKNSAVNRLSAILRDYLWNWWFLNIIKDQLDFVGVNFYQASHVDWLFRQRNPSSPVSDLGWYMNPAGIYDVLVGTYEKYNKPLIITENGVSDSEDKHRQWWIKETTTAMQKALSSGVDLRGYLHWSLLDNFEWSFGWWPEFGLISVDRKSGKRTIRPSAKWFSNEIKKL